ncbi:MAG: class I SAM-dependent methyltransferase [Elusimicrobiota bacterium]|nr:class I SAM-dependent methyltransferase [Elusimicrobiota bacterium]
MKPADKKDNYVNAMDWGADLEGFELSNYRKYQFDLIGKYIGRNILEIGTGDRSFTSQIVRNVKDIERLVSIEPSSTLFELYKDKYRLPAFVSVECVDLFDVTPATHGLFDTIVLTHVLEHIEKDREALTHLHTLLRPGGRILIEVPAMPSLFSVHDRSLGHYRRYNKINFRSAVDSSLFNIKDLWFQDQIGMLGSFIFFKMKKIELKSEQGASLVTKQGALYDKYVIPLERFYDRFLRFPFGLSLTGILEKREV